MGGIVSGIGNALGGAAGAVGGVLGKVPVVGPVLGPAASIAMGGNPFLAIGGGLYNAANGGFGGGGGGSSSGAPASGTGGTSTPTYTYTYGDKPYDASKYFVEGNKGVYNLLPQLGGLYGDTAVQQRAGAPSANLYNDILTNIRMNQDTLAEQNFQKNFGLQTYNPNVSNPTTLASDFAAPDYVKSNIQNALGEYYPGGTGSGTVPVNYADFGFGENDTLSKIAQYAKKENNPFFVPYASADVRPEIDTRPQPIMPVSSNPQVAQPLRYAPSQDARGPAPRDIAPASVATSGSYRPIGDINPASTTAAAPAAPGAFKPVNIRTGGLASLRRK
jgi:hypothetical protein